jgi:hypothetical protein
MDAQGHGGHDDAIGAQPAYRLLQPAPRIVPHRDDQLGVGRHLNVPHTQAAGAGHQAVVMQRGHRNAQRDPGRHPAAHDQLGEVLAGQGGGERAVRRRAAASPHGRADHRELDGAGGQVVRRDLVNLHRRAHHAVTA